MHRCRRRTTRHCCDCGIHTAVLGARLLAGCCCLLLLLLLCLVLPLTQPTCAQEEEEELPDLLDADDIAYFFARNELDELQYYLKQVFERSARNPTTVNDNDDRPLPEQLVARGGGTTYTTKYKLQHDLEQAEYLLQQHSDDDQHLSTWLRYTVIPTYRTILDRIPDLNELTKTRGLYPLSQEDRQLLAPVYNKAWYFPKLDHLAPETSFLHPDLDIDDIEQQWSGTTPSRALPSKQKQPQKQQQPHPGIVVIDNLLTNEALEALQRLLWESTFWYQTKLPLTFGGYVGAYIDDGMYDSVFLQLAQQLAEHLPMIAKHRHPLRYLWAYKYDSNYTGINLHADQAAVNVNIWLTPNDANLDPDSGGLVVYQAKPPDDWDFARYNTDTDFVRHELLEPTNFANVTIPYRTNRAVIFDSALFHQTDTFRFRPGYKNRRINLTLLYGEMQRSSTTTSNTDGSPAGKQEQSPPPTSAKQEL